MRRCCCAARMSTVMDRRGIIGRAAGQGSIEKNGSLFQIEGTRIALGASVLSMAVVGCRPKQRTGLTCSRAW